MNLSMIRDMKNNSLKSLAEYDEALKFINKEDYPYHYAGICHSKGVAFICLAQTEQMEENIEKAFRSYEEP